MLIHDPILNYWIGYSDHRHVGSDGFRAYVFLKGYWENEADALSVLESLPPDYAFKQL